MSAHDNNTQRPSGLQGAMGRNWRAPGRNGAQTSNSRMTGTLFYSVPTIDNKSEDSEEEDGLPMHESYMPDYDSEEDGSDSSTHSPPMSLFLDRHPQPEAPPLTPAAIYLDVPPPVSTKTKSSGTLGEQLLAPTAIPSGPTGWTSISYKRNFKDSFFAALYILALVAYFILGIVLLFTTSSSPLEGQIYNVFSAIKSSAARRLGDSIVGAVFRICDIYLVARVVIPGAKAREWKAGSTGHRTDCAVYATIGHWINLACEILKDNPDMFFVSFGLMAVHVVFTAIWLVFFARVFLLGHVEQAVGSKSWVLEDNFYPIAAYLIFIYMWTSAVLSNIQRVTLANVVSKWYFHSSKITEPALVNAMTTSFGSICLGALFIAIVQFTVFALRNTAKKLKGHSFPLFVFIATCCRVIQSLVENFNNYTLIYVGITGESLFAAARSASKIFHRNLLWGLLSDVLTKLILFINSAMLSLLTGFVAYIFATHTLNSPYGYIIGILSTIIPFYVTRFFTHIMAITVDATFLCYAIDLDTNTCHSNKAHSAFGVSH
ncbi:hypothetical protein BG011_000236 [Mortierella polycephala]|uniref:Protein PNS1 n=1 Tax=Mortierella polycephala TaxID=41804 RepID=A0A9P6U6Y9_9FUNG|nr:hypothetical protein BG011_000236 [Mortierella polycephala]